MIHSNCFPMHLYLMMSAIAFAALLSLNKIYKYLYILIYNKDVLNHFTITSSRRAMQVEISTLRN